MSVYSITWKYQIIRYNEKEFEFEYGPEGAWSKLFHTSKDYCGSHLYKNDEQAHNYMLLDTWTSQKAYEKFLENNKEEYMQLCEKLAHLYLLEEKTGTYLLVE